MQPPPLQLSKYIHLLKFHWLTDILRITYLYDVLLSMPCRVFTSSRKSDGFKHNWILVVKTTTVSTDVTWPPLFLARGGRPERWGKKKNAVTKITVQTAEGPHAQHKHLSAIPSHRNPWPITSAATSSHSLGQRKNESLITDLHSRSIIEERFFLPLLFAHAVPAATEWLFLSFWSFPHLYHTTAAHTVSHSSCF